MKQFGIITTIDGLTGSVTINGINRNETVDVAEARNEKGKVTDRKAYSKKQTIRIDGLLDTAEMPSESITAGAVLMVGGKNYLIDSCDVNEANQDYAKISLSCSTADTATIAAYETEVTGG